MENVMIDSRRPARLVLALAALSLAAPHALEAQINGSDDPLLRPFTWRSIGPIGQGGRVDDIAVSPTDPHTYFVGFATGGLWKTTNNGVTFRPVFDDYADHSVGAIAISPADPDIVWVGTGESNNRQSSSFGGGIYRSTDGGESFELVGLQETQSIARVVAHPTDPDVVWVAANGHLYGPNPDRGVFRTTDGGATWEAVLQIDENTGATDLVIDPSDPNTLFAATYQRRRTACCFVGGGPGSGIWRTRDGGERWDRIEDSGLPNGTLGRIALAMTPADPGVVYAQIEVAADRETPLTESERAEWEQLARDDELPPDPQYSGVWRSNDKGDSWEFRSNENGRPMYFSQIRVDPSDPEIVYVVAQNVFQSTDGGRSFEQLRGYGHVDQHAFWIDPADPSHLMIGNDGSVDVSWDRGQTWESLRTWAVGQPYHASVDMRRPYFVCTGLQDNGTWCGPSSVRNGPILAQDWYRVGGGDGFYSAVDPTDYAVVFRESQGGNIGRTNLRTGASGSIRPRAPSENNPNSNIVPTPPVGTEIRWNWSTPFILSPHNPQVIHAGGNRLFTSRDRGETWTMTPDLTLNADRDAVVLMGQANALPRCNQLERGVECILSRNDGVSRFGTLTSVSESPIVPGVLWVGSDDGALQVSRDGGASWDEVGANIPGGTRGYYISRVEASHFDEAVAFASLDGHRSDDLRPYVFMTRDFGQSWQSISDGLPERGNVRTVRQDLRNANLLFAGTEFGFFISLDQGGSWQPFMNGLPTVRVDDVLVHPRDNDLVLATHGRSVWVLDDITALQAATPGILREDTYLFEPREAVLWQNDPRLSRSVTGNKNWRGDSAAPGTAISYYLGSVPSGEMTLTVENLASGDVFRDLEPTTVRGLNRVQWDMRGNPPPRQEGQGGGFGGGRFGNRGPLAEAGVYRVTLTVDGQDFTRLVKVVEDLWADQR
jgi:photosystem II stability/assembly factor-like uncharacterized protein